IPTVIDGKFFTPDGRKPPVGSPEEKKMIQAAIAYHRSDPTQPHLGVFDSPENANAYAQALHDTPRMKGGERYLAPIMQPNRGRMALTPDTHDIVAMPTGHIVALPSDIPMELKHSIAADM